MDPKFYHVYVTDADGDLMLGGANVGSIEYSTGRVLLTGLTVTPADSQTFSFAYDSEDIVVIQARRPSGNQAKFKIELDGKVRYEFDNYRGQSCKEDMVKVLPRLSEVYGVDLSDERVIWSNPDDEDQEMKPITPHNLNHH